MRVAEDVVAGPAVEDVVSGAAVELVVAVSAVQGVRARRSTGRVPDQRVVPVAGVERVVL